MAATTDQGTVHVPAWKKLGLKLKYAREDAIQPFAPASKPWENTTVHKKRRYPADLRPNEGDGAASKKVHISSPPGQEPAGGNGDAQETKTASPSKRKSVSFAPETKKEDGDSVKEKYKNWFASEKAQDPSLDVSELNPAIVSIEETISKSSPTNSRSPKTSKPKASPGLSEGPQVEKKKKKKKPKKKKGNPPASSTPAAADFTATLTYLDSHHKSPSTWKFSKPHQSRLLKRLFDLSAVPSPYDSALLSYLRGLASAATRSRIRDEALEVRKSDDTADVVEPQGTSSPPSRGTPEPLPSAGDESAPDMDYDKIAAQTRARRRQEYEHAVTRMRSVLEARADLADEWADHVEWTDRLQRRRRAEVVLWAVGETPSADPNPPPPSTTTTTTTTTNTHSSNRTIRGEEETQPKTTTNNLPKAKRKRKHKDRRGAIPDDLSSSSDSDSDNTTARNHKAAATADQARQQRETLARRRRELERLRREAEEDLDSESGSGGGSESETIKGD